MSSAFTVLEIGHTINERVVVECLMVTQLNYEVSVLSFWAILMEATFAVMRSTGYLFLAIYGIDWLGKCIYERYILIIFLYSILITLVFALS